MTDLERVLTDLYARMFEAGKRADKSKRPEVRDAIFSCAAMVAKEALAQGYKVSEGPHGP